MSTVEFVRTPEERFVGLPGYPFHSHYLYVREGNTKLRVHYLDEGNPKGQVILLMHGEPSWSYLYRKMIPPLVSAGYRCIAPDLVGFGKSDKPTKTTDYTYAKHIHWMESLLVQLKLTNIVLFAQDWGGLIGLRLVSAHPENFIALVLANTGLPSGENSFSTAFLAWRKFAATTPSENFIIGNIVAGGCSTTLSDEVIAAYNAPFPSDIYKSGARIFPSLVPILPEIPEASANKEAWKILEGFTKPVLTMFSDEDKITQGGESIIKKKIPGAKHDRHVIIRGGNHFLQEDKGEEIARELIKWLSDVLKKSKL